MSQAADRETAKRNVALFLGVAAGDWYDSGRPRLAIQECVPALVGALADSDNRVRELAAQAVGATGAAGASAVPALIGLLGSSSEGDRNTACIGLAGIGPKAGDALPALKKALSDPSATVRSFARRAIERIERYQRIGFRFDEPWGGFYAIGYLDGLEVHLKEAPKNQAERQWRRDNEHLDAAAGVDGIEAFHEQCVANGVTIIKPLAATAWATKDFYIEDPDGYIISFGGNPTAG